MPTTASRAADQKAFLVVAAADHAPTTADHEDAPQAARIAVPEAPDGLDRTNSRIFSTYPSGRTDAFRDREEKHGAEDHLKSSRLDH
jgi:hypothetical protein